MFITLSKEKLSYSPSHTFIEDTNRHHFAQMASISKTYSSCVIFIIIKLCHKIDGSPAKEIKDCGRTSAEIQDFFFNMVFIFQSP